MKLIVALCGGASLLAMATTAFAQQAPADQQQAAAPSTTSQTIVVTGSRIIRNGYAAPTPVTVAPAADLEALTPSDIPDALNKLPEFAGSTGSQGGAIVNGVPGNYLNLRDFGIIRTLILMNGLRVAPNSFNGQVDVNSIPQMLLQRVDVVTGGASAVYGSDAVTGVVNFIMDNHYNGLKGEAETGISGYGDARSDRYGLAAGSDVLDHGHVEASFEHYEEAGLNASQREFSSARNVFVGAGTAASPYTLISHGGIPATAFGGLATSGPFQNQQFLANGQLGPYTPGATTPTSTIVAGGNAVYYQNAPLTAPQNEDQAFARFDYDFTDYLSGFVQGSDTWSLGHENNSNWPQQTLPVFSGNPFLPTSAQSQLTAANAASFNDTVFPRELELMGQQTQSTSAGSLTAGLNGKVDGFKWNADYTHSVSIYRQSLTNNINVPNYLAAADAVPGPNGPQCYVSTTPNAALYPGCVPLNIFGVGNESAAALAYIYQTTSFRVANFFDDYNASISGNAFNDWAGPVSVALDAEYRQQSLQETTNASPTAPVTNVTGVLRDVPLVANPITHVLAPTVPTTVYAYATNAANSGSNSVWEIGGETVVPILKDLPFAKSLDVSGAVRYTDYSSSGSVVTWKAGLDYQPVDDIRFRATESQDIRAPTLYDLYQGQSFNIVNVNDVPYSGQTKVTTVTTQGNPNLVPEKALTTTAGVVYSPSWLPRFRISVDYYDITINNAIVTLAGNQAAVMAQCAATPTAPICSVLVRGNGPGAFPTAIYSEPLNVAQTWTQGLDVEASYNVRLEDWVRQLRGNVNFRLLYSFQPVLDTVNFAGAPAINSAGNLGGQGAAGVSSNRVTLMVAYELGPVSAAWQTRWSSALGRGPAANAATPNYYASSEVPAYTVNDVNLNYRFKVDAHAFNMFFNIQNLFDAQPRISPSTGFGGIPGFGSSAVAGDDVIGRYFTMGLKFNY